MPPHFWLILVTVYGACIGSFLNVVIYRMPEGLGLATPRSSCPECHHPLAWFDNIPIVGWLLLAGKCRYCRCRISPQYPLVEAICAGLFAAVFLLDYASGLRPAFYQAGLSQTWPAMVVQLVLVAGLLAATVIDAKLFIIPIRIPHTVTLIAVLVLPIAAIWLPAMERTAPVVGPAGLGFAVGGMAGLVLSLLLLHLKLLPRSFDEMEEVLDESYPPDAFLDHPHPRREVLKECLFLALPILGAAIGYWLMFVPQSYLPTENQYPLAVRVLGGVIGGYLVGGGVVWGVRILGTLAFGREAMGLGDVHLLAAIGAVIGSIDAVGVFFMAPFFGLAGAAIQGGVQLLWKSRGRVIPYGPYLALATLVVMVIREPMWTFFGIF